MENDRERDNLRNKLDEAESKWKSLNQKYAERSKDLEELYPLSQKYDEEAVTFSVWLEKTEKRKTDLENQSLSPNESDLKKQRQDCKVCRLE